MKVNLSHSTAPPVRSNAAKEAPKHEPGPVRDYLEKTGGVVQAVGRAPGSFLSGLVIGGYHGMRRAADETYQTNPLHAATGIVLGNAAQGLLVGAAGAFLVLGPVGAGASVAKDALQSGFETYLFVKGGSAGEMGKRLAADIDGAVTSENNPVSGMLIGAWKGGVSAAKGAAVTGFYEGRAGTSGLFEGAKEIKAEYSLANAPQGNGFQKAARGAVGTVAAAVSAPAGLALALLDKNFETKPPKALTRVALAAASGAVIGATVGLIGGPVGALVGSAVGTVVGLIGPARKAEFATGIKASLERARSDNGDMGHDITNKRRDLVESTIVGLSSGVRQGWNAGAGSHSEAQG